MGAEQTENSADDKSMNRTLSESSTESYGTFSDCSSDRSGELPVASQISKCLLISSAASESHYSDDLVRSLIADLDSDSVEFQRHAAMELRLLAKHSKENSLRIARSGAIRPLIALISSPDPQLQEHGVTSVLNLSICDENKGQIVAAGAIKPLIRALKSGTTAARENAACAIFRLAQIEDHREAIGWSGAIPLLVEMLETGGARGKKDASTALYTLCKARENKIRAVRAGVMTPLLELMADSESGMVDKATAVLSTLVAVAEGRKAAVEEGGISVLVEIVEMGSLRQKEIAAATLLQICEESVAYRGMVAREGAIPPLVALSQAGNTRAKQKIELLIDLLRQTRSRTSHGMEASDV